MSIDIIYRTLLGVMRKMKLRKLVTELETGGEYEQAKQIRETGRGNKRMGANLAKWWGGEFGTLGEKRW
jgi:hypothetical protein